MLDDDAAPPSPEPPTTVGSLLCAAREARRLTLLHVSDALRIEPQQLAALEHDRFDLLGAPVFVKGYIKNYAEYLGLDPQPFLAAYRSQCGDEMPSLVGRRSIEAQPARPVSGWAVVVLVALAVVAFVALRQPFEGFGRLAAPSAPVPAETDAVPPTTAAPPARGALDGGREPLPDGAAAAALPVAARSATDASETAVPTDADSTPPGATGTNSTVRVTTGADSTASAQEASDSGAAAPDAAVLDATGDAARSAAGTELRVELRFVEDSWAEITGPDARRLFYGLGRAGAEARFDAAPPIAVLLGNADGVAMQVDGRPFTYPADSRRGNRAQFTLTAAAAE